ALGAAFFAALFVVLGHLVYQTRAPDEVKSYTWEEFISFRKADYREHKTADALTRARYYLATQAAQRLKESETYELDSLIYDIHSEKDKRKDKLQRLERPKLEELVDYLRSDKTWGPQKEILDEAQAALAASTPPSDLTAELNTIERGARAEYLTRAS